MIALGDKAGQDLSYYSSIHQKAEESSLETEMTIPIENADFSSNTWKMIKDKAIDTHKLIPENTTKEVISEAAEQSSSINDDLKFVFNDLKQ